MRIISRGNSPVRAHRSTMFKRSVGALSTGAEQLTVEAAVGHVELLEVRECAPFRRDSTGEFVAIAVTVAKVEHFEGDWELLGQFA